MYKQVLTLAFLAGALTLAQQDSGSIDIWKKDDLMKRSAALSPKLDAFHSGNEVVATRGNRRFLLARREGNGQAEWHQDEADIMMIVSGKVTLIYGGEVINGKTTAPGEIRGDSIKGGREAALGPGDVFHIPAKVPHLMKVNGVLTYFVAKVRE